MKFTKALTTSNENKNLGILRRIKSPKSKNHQILLSVKNGDFSKEDFCFLQDEEGKEYVVFPQKLFMQLLAKIKDMQEERFMMMLEKDLISQMPIDFEDVMAVAREILESMRQSDGNLPEINSAVFAKELKEKYPNLFFDIDYLRRVR